MGIQKIWQQITNIGVDEAALGREVVKVRLLNQLMFSTLFTSIFVLISYLIIGEGRVIILTTLINMIIEFTGLFLSYKKKHLTARHFAFLGFPTWLGVSVVLNGGGFGEANIFSVLAFSSFIMYENQPKFQIPSVVYITTIFILSKLYVLNNIELSEQLVNPYDEIITFPFTLFMLGLIILLYQREIKKFENQRNRLIGDLKEKNTKLTQVNEELEQFTYIASHDLKTPLRTISSHLDLIKWHIKKKNYDAVDEDIDFAKKGAKQMYSLISDILEYKKLDDRSTETEKIDLSQLIREVQQKIQTYITEKKAVIKIEELPTINIKYNDALILFQNIIENGIKYNQSDIPKIHIYHEPSEEYLIINIADNGIGIEVEYHERIFQFFKRLHGQEEYEGTGIGLGLCQKIIQRYGGEISVKKGENNGSIFSIRLPLDIMSN